MNEVATIQPQRQSLIAKMAHEYGMEPKAFADTIRATCMPTTASNEEFAAFLLVAREHGLNPVTREIYAFPKKGGGIQPIVGVDGWFNMINSHPQCDGVEFDDHLDDKRHLTAITCRIYRKDRSRPTSVTEYMEECKRPTEPWQKWPARMLRHKAAIQCARYAFGFAGIIDPEEAERSPEVITGQVQAPPPPEPKHEEQPQGNVVDAEEEEVAVEEDKPAEREPIDYGDYFERLQEALQGVTDAEGVEEVWVDFGPEATFQDDEDSMKLALLIKERKLAAIHPINAG